MRLPFKTASTLPNLLLSTIVLTFVAACNPGSESGITSDEGLIQQVNPFIGTALHGHVYPGATVPFGMVQLSPDNGTQGWDWCSGYNYADSLIVGFSHTHLSGTGIGDLCDVSLMPANHVVDLNKIVSNPRENSYVSSYSHDNESAMPGYYQVKLDNGIQAELTAGLRSGLHRYTFPEGAEASLIVDLAFAVNWDRPTATMLQVVNDTLVTGYRKSSGWAKDQRIFFAMMFSQPISRFAIRDSVWTEPAPPVPGQGTKAQLFFDNLPQRKLEVKVSISSANVDGALAGLNDILGRSFDQMLGEAKQAWNQELAKVEVESHVDSLETIFYTSLYHTAVAPVVHSDALGWFKTPNDQVRQANGYQRYDIFSLWDTFRAANPLYTLTQPDKVNDMVKSLIDHYQTYGLLPVWSLLGNETNTMTGYHAVPVIVDAYMKGYRNYNVDTAYAAMVKSAMQDIRGTNFYRQYGFIPYDKDGQSVTKTLEYAFDDWCIAQMAKALGKQDDYKLFSARAASYKQLFDKSTGFMRAKLSDGKWKSPFDPKFSDHNFEVAEYTEGNAWQHSWFVPHDIPGLIALHGGDAPFIAKLDGLFTESSEITGENASADISGLIGQYAHGNEPSHHIVYMYNFAGAPWKTQARVREIMSTQYNATPAGLCGNEDCGQMSAWYVFSAMGFYPVNPASGIYVIGSPTIDRLRLKVRDGKHFEVVARDNSSQNVYIQSAKLNGKPLERSYLTHEEIQKGGRLELQMGPEPNKKLWNSAQSRPK